MRVHSNGSTGTTCPRIHSLVRRMLNDDDADEVTQDVFVRPGRSSAPSGASPRSEPGFTGWR